MPDCLALRPNQLPETRQESLTRQFYEWEKRGRGWHLYSYPVELEPPFRPMIILESEPAPVTDDSRQHGFFSRMFAPTSPRQPVNTAVEQYQQLRERIAEADEPVVCDYYEEDFCELEIILREDLKVSKSTALQFLSSLTYCRHPLSFEVIGTEDEVSIRIAATEQDLDHLTQQLRAYFPDALIREPDETLDDIWDRTEGYVDIVDFGLLREFFLPLSPISSLENDPLIAIVGAMAGLQEDEAAVFQVLFQRTRNDWPVEILDSLRFDDGSPFFANAPELTAAAKQKISSPIFAAVVRVAAKSWGRDRSKRLIRGLASGLSQLTNPIGNQLMPLSNDGYHSEYHERTLLRRLSFRSGVLLNQDELVSLIHPPSGMVRSEKLVRDDERTKAAPGLAKGNELVIGVNEHQRTRNRVTLSSDQRTRHMHVIGSSGSGKSTLLLDLIRQDLDNRHGLCVIDPHGDLIDQIIDSIPGDRADDVILFDPSDADFPIGFNILQANSELEKTILSSDLTATFRRMSTSWGDVMDSVLANAILAFVTSPRRGTLFELKRFLVEKEFRHEFLSSIGDETVRYFWEHEFEMIAGRPQASILIRLDTFLRQPLIRNIVCQEENRLDFRQIMDGRKVLLVKLSHGLVGTENAYMLGSLIVSRLYQAALTRQETKERPYFWLYMDEFHNFITPSMEQILSGTRKYNMGLVLAHQEYRQLQSRSLDVASSVMSNCYTRICFRLGDTDAAKFSDGFSFFTAKDLTNLGVGEAVGRVERAEYDFNLKISPR